METYFKALDELLESKRPLIPNCENSLSGIAQKLKGLQKIITPINEEVHELKQKYLPNDLSKEQNEEIHSASVRKIQDFINSFEIPMVDAQVSER